MRYPDSWAPSTSSTHYQTIPGGTPGRVNAAHVSSEPPRVLKQGSLPARIDLGAPLGLTLQLDSDGPAASKVEVLYQLATGAGLGEEARLSLDSSGFTYSARIPAQAAEGVLRYAYEIVGKDGAIRRFPHEHALRPMFSVFVSNPVAGGSIPSARFILPEGNIERVQRFRYGRREGQAQAFPAQGTAAIVLTDHETKASVLFDYIHIKPRSGGYKVRLHKDRLWRELSTINILKMYAPRQTLCESLAFEFHRRAGVPSSWADYVQLSIDGKAQGIHLAFEQPNKSFLRRHDLDDDGNLYKAIWQGSHQPSPRAYPRG